MAVRYFSNDNSLFQDLSCVKVISGTILDNKGLLIEVEVDLCEGFPKFDIVGITSNSSHETKERIRTGIKNSGYNFPYKRITVTLSPAHSHNDCVGFYLAIAVGILCSDYKFSSDSLVNTLIIGELALSGEVRPINGVRSLVAEAKKSGIKRCILPEGNYQEASLEKDIDLIPIATLNQVVNVLKEC